MEEEKWRYIKISQIDDKIIKQLVNNLKQDVSEDFFLSFDSLLKINKRAESEIERAIRQMDEQHQFKKHIFKFLLNYIKTDKIESPLLFQLYSPDFLVRAKAVLEIGKIDSLKYLNFLLPLLRDPDDSVRWSVINLLINKHINNSKIYKKLKKHVENESNPIIRKNLAKVFEKV